MALDPPTHFQFFFFDVRIFFNFATPLSAVREKETFIYLKINFDYFVLNMAVRLYYTTLPENFFTVYFKLLPSIPLPMVYVIHQSQGQKKSCFPLN